MAKPVEQVRGVQRFRPSAPSSLADVSDVLSIGLMLWSASVLRVVHAFLQHEVFGAEATLALACAVLLPVALLRGRRRRIPRDRVSRDEHTSSAPSA